MYWLIEQHEAMFNTAPTIHYYYYYVQCILLTIITATNYKDDFYLNYLLFCYFAWVLKNLTLTVSNILVLGMLDQN